MVSNEHSCQCAGDCVLCDGNRFRWRGLFNAAPQQVGMCAGYGDDYTMFIALGAGTVISNVMIQSGGKRCQ